MFLAGVSSLKEIDPCKGGVQKYVLRWYEAEEKGEENCKEKRTIWECISHAPLIQFFQM